MEIVRIKRVLPTSDAFDVTLRLTAADIQDAIAKVTALVQGDNTDRASVALAVAKMRPAEISAALPSEEQAAVDKLDAAIHGGRRRRQPRHAPTPGQSHPETPAAPAAALEVSGTRRRRVAASEGEAVTASLPEISDADLTKAASNAAFEIAKATGGGTETVMAVLEDLGCKNVNEVPAEKRREFLDSLAEEIALAKAEAAAKVAA